MKHFKLSSPREVGGSIVYSYQKSILFFTAMVVFLFSFNFNAIGQSCVTLGGGDVGSALGAATDRGYVGCGMTSTIGPISSGTLNYFTISDRSQSLEITVCPGPSAPAAAPQVEIWEETTTATVPIAIATTADVNGCVTVTYDGSSCAATKSTPNIYFVIYDDASATCGTTVGDWAVSASATCCTIDAPIADQAETIFLDCTMPAFTIPKPSTTGVCDATDLAITNSTPDISASLTAHDTYYDVSAGLAAGTYTITWQNTACGTSIDQTLEVRMDEDFSVHAHVNGFINADVCAYDLQVENFLVQTCDGADYSNYTISVQNPAAFAGATSITEPGVYTVVITNTNTGKALTSQVTVIDNMAPMCPVEDQLFVYRCGEDIIDEVPNFIDCSTDLNEERTVADETIEACESFQSPLTFDATDLFILDASGNPIITGQGDVVPNIPLADLPPYLVANLGNYELSKVVVRNWRATDTSGNQGSVCPQFHYFFRPIIGAIQLPTDIHIDGCTAGTSPDELAQLSITNVPHFFNFKYDAGNDTSVDNDLPNNLVDDNGEAQILRLIDNDDCRYFVRYEDTDLGLTCAGLPKFRRVYSIVDCCDGFMERTGGHLIFPEDNTAPVFTNCPTPSELGGAATNPIQLSTTENDCFFNDLLTFPTATDVCTSVELRAQVNDVTGNPVIIDGITPTSVFRLNQGDYQIVFSATDDCGNVTNCTQYYTVVDLTPPVAICDNVNVGLSTTIGGAVRIYATSVNEGSYDNCGNVSILVRRMDDDTFADYLTVDCNDVANSPIMVVLQATDQSGNTSTCMREVQVDDKSAPTLIAPPSITVSCANQEYLDLAITGDIEMGSSASNSINGYAYDNCGLTHSNISHIDNTTNFDCNTTSFTRTWTLTYDNGKTINRDQTIYITNTENFSVTFQEDITIESCDIANVLDNVQAPTVETNGCYTPLKLLTKVEEATVGNAGVCKIFLVTYRYASACTTNFENLNQGVQDANNPLKYDVETGGVTYTQKVSVIDNTPPSLDFVDGSTINYSDNSATCSMDYTTNLFASDNCSDANIEFQYKLEDAAGTTVLTGTTTGNLDGDSSFDYHYAFGSYKVTITATDQCGNATTKSFNLNIVDGKKPTPFAIDGVNSVVMEVSGCVTFNVEHIFSHAIDNCTSPEYLENSAVIKIANSTDLPAKELQVCCDDIDANGEITVELYVTDEAGNTEFTTVKLGVQDNNNVCNNDGSRPVSGKLKDQYDAPVDNSMIMVSGDSEMELMVDEQGNFGGDLKMGGSYRIQPIKNDDHGNGITTFDAILMIKHILGSQILESPYTQIAADVNNDGEIGIEDILELRQLILGIRTEFSNNNSWKFVDASFNFPNSGNAFETEYPQSKTIDNIGHSITNQNFVAIKIGDLNLNAYPNEAARGRNDSYVGTSQVTVSSNSIVAGSSFSIDVSASDLENLAGIQFGLVLSNAALDIQEVIPNKSNGVDASNLALNKNGLISFSWNGDALNNDTKLFTVKGIATQTVNLEDVVAFNERTIAAEAYSNDLEIFNLRISTTKNNDGFTVSQNSPNPFQNQTIIDVIMPTSGEAEINIFNITGARIYSEVKQFNKGLNHFILSSKDIIGEGVFHYEVVTKHGKVTKRMLLTK